MATRATASHIELLGDTGATTRYVELAWCYQPKDFFLMWQGISMAALLWLAAGYRRINHENGSLRVLYLANYESVGRTRKASAWSAWWTTNTIETPSAKSPFVCLMLRCLSKSGTLGSLCIPFSCLSIGLIIWYRVCKGSLEIITLGNMHNCDSCHELSSQCWLTHRFHVQ
jgi:hypothetical protein